jgi:hypothetical protein
MTCRDWLKNSGYEDVARLIDEAIARMAARGSKQRRNWWDILSGGAGGKPCVREGIEFPVLRVAQIRQGKPITKNSIARSIREDPPDVVASGRWPKSPEPIRPAVVQGKSHDFIRSDELKRRKAS